MTSQLLRYAHDCARITLQSVSPQAWARSGRAAAHAAHVVGELDRPRGDAIVAAAWLHAIGESPRLVRTGFAPVDGALHLLGEGWPAPVTSLVAFQGQARLLAPAFRADGQLALFERIQGWPSDILDYACVMALSDETPADPDLCLRMATPAVPGVRNGVHIERERRLRRALDRVTAELIAVSSPASSTEVALQAT